MGRMEESGGERDKKKILREANKVQKYERKRQGRRERMEREIGKIEREREERRRRYREEEGRKKEQNEGNYK